MHFDYDQLPVRKSPRLKEFDYSAPNYYFVTICTQGRKKRLSDIVGDGSPVPKLPGRIAEAFIHRIPQRFPQVCVDKYVIMPNHIHLILQLTRSDGTGDPSPTLGQVVGWYKYQTTKYTTLKCGPGEKLFQRSYHDHVIRGEKDYLKNWNYIDGNPSKWLEDCFYVED